MGAVYLVALFPLIFEFRAILGENGLLPAHDLLTEAYAELGIWGFFKFPSLYWIWPSDTMILIILVMGVIAALFLLVRKWIFPASIVWLLPRFYPSAPLVVTSWSSSSICFWRNVVFC